MSANIKSIRTFEVSRENSSFQMKIIWAMGKRENWFFSERWKHGASGINIFFYVNQEALFLNDLV